MRRATEQEAKESRAVLAQWEWMSLPWWKRLWEWIRP